ncbi:hypothetical protein RI129_003793 [Pyrocoelia pectoralis]|uniref:Uncharacterized protein n=1 Tax=Pyrocoelia pectoralis TaxID=417401 RepID=A0AAN7VR24_9COLE
MDIKSLPQDVQDYLRSGPNIKSISQCIMELVLNSLDAKSTAVAVRANLLTFRIQVVDNGIGVTQLNMGAIGLQHMTSKCQSIADLNKIKHFGFRGEALASISKMSKKVSIISRPKDVENTYSKTYENGKWSETENVKLRAGQGTTVTVTEFMHNFPVRQKRVNKHFDLEETKKNIIALAIIHPKITFSLRNDTTGKVILQSRRASNVAQAIFNFYPEILVEEFAELKVSKNNIKVAGLIYKQSHNNGTLQYIFLNKRPIVSQKIQKLLNSSLEKISSKNEHPVYCLNISCPCTQVDLTLSPSKTTVEFKNWDIILKCIEKGIHTVLKDNNLAICTTQQFPITSGKRASLSSQFGLTQVKGVIMGKRVKRNDPSSELLLACSDPVPNVELYNKEQLTPIDNKSNKQDEHVITQNLVKAQAHNSYCSTVTNSLNNQEKGKSLMLNMFLKSTVAFPMNKSHKTNTLMKARRRNITNTLTMTLYTKRTIMRNSHCVENQKNAKMISKCVQTTRIQQEDTININFVPNYCLSIPRPHFSNKEQVKKVSYLNENFSNFHTLNRYGQNFGPRQNCVFPPFATVIPKYQSHNPIYENYINNFNLPSVCMYSPYFTRDAPTSHEIQDIIYPSFKRTFPLEKTDIRRKYFDCINLNTIPDLFGGTNYTITKSKKTSTRRERKRQINTTRKNDLKHAGRDFEQNRVGNKRAPRKMKGTFLRKPNKFPKATESFNAMKRMDFVPKGSSPILYQTKKFDKSLSPNSKKKLHKALIKCHEDELNTIKWSNYIHEGIGVTQFFDQLYNEKCKQFDTTIQNVSVSAFSRSMIKTCNHLQTQYFTKDIFMDITIIGQLDRKFIVTFCKSKELIILFDQHAVSERVRLENLLKDYKENDQFKTTKCNNVIIDVFPSRDLIILANYKKYFEALGLFYKIGRNTLEITHVPSCICSKFEKDVIIPLINEQIDTILSTRVASHRMPAVIQNVINMEACRGAIKFGKLLSMQEIETLIKNLSKCQLPFQCAHGRPTLSPIINLQQNTVHDYILKPPNLRKLKQY